MSRNQILLGVIVAALLALGAAAWFIMGKPDTDPTAGSGSGGGPVTTADDRTLGDPKAPAVVIEYAAPMCPHCKRMNEEGIPDLKANYIDKGKVFYIFRVFPIGAADVPAETLARCLPKESYFPFIDLLYSKQESWDPEYGITDVQGGLIALARIAGLTSDQALACMNDKAKQARVAAVAQDAMTRYGVTGTPTFVINGEVQTPGAPWTAVKARLDAVLAKK
ncbi:MAG: thioredoxin domain-containing protein [Rhizomicrobium sp.]